MKGSFLKSFNLGVITYGSKAMATEALLVEHPQGGPLPPS